MGAPQQALLMVGAAVSSVAWNPSDKSSNTTLSNGNLTATASGGGNGQVRSTVSYSSTGKYYWEVRLDLGPTASDPYLGIRPAANTLTGNGPADPGGDYGCFAQSPNSGHTDYIPGSNTGNVGPALAVSDVYLFAIDFAAGKLWIGRNGTWDASGNPSAGTNPKATGISGAYAAWAAVNGAIITARFTRSAMTYTVPTGFLAYDGT